MPSLNPSDAGELLKRRLHDERLPVTCKWLSRQENIPVAEARRQLDDYRTSATDGELHSVYWVSGFASSSHITGYEGKVLHIRLVPEELLPTVKASYLEIVNVSLYSIQVARSVNSTALYLSDHDKGNKFLESDIRNAPIRYDGSLFHEHVSSSSSQKATDHQEEPEQKSGFTHVKEAKKDEKVPKTDKKAGPSKKEKSFFTAFNPSAAPSQSSRSDDDRKKVTGTDVRLGDDEVASSTGSTRAERVKRTKDKHETFPEGDLFTTGSSPESSPVKVSPKRNEMGTKAKDASQRSKPKGKNKGSREAASKPKPTPSHMGDDDEADFESTGEVDKGHRGQSSRKRIASGSNDAGGVIPETQEPGTVSSTAPERSQGSDGSESKRKYKKGHLVSKTFLDEEGYMVTKKVYEEDEYEEVGNDERPCDRSPVRKSARFTPSPVKVKSTDKEPDEPEPTKPKGKGRQKKPVATSGKNQASLTTFFKKK